MKSILDKSIRGEKGQALILVLILLLVGSLILTPLLSFMSTGLMAVRAQEERMCELYAADAGVEYALWQVIHNEDATGTYQLTVNEKVVNVDIAPEQTIEDFLYELLGEDAGVHGPWAVVNEIVGEGTYSFSITYTGAAATKHIRGIGAWLQGDYQLEGSPSGITVDYPADVFTVSPYKGGTAFIWQWTDAAGSPEFVKTEPPDTKAQTFGFKLAIIPPYHFSWVDTGSADIGTITSGVTFAVWKVTATATDPDTAKGTEVISYVRQTGTEAPYAVEILTWESSVLQ